MKTHNQISLTALVMILASTGSASADTQGKCSLLKTGFRMTLHVQDGSSLDVARALACLGGKEIVRKRGFADVPIQADSRKPLSYHGAFQEIRKSMSSNCLRIRSAGKRLILDGAGHRCRPKPGPVRGIRIDAPRGKNLVVLSSNGMARITRVLEKGVSTKPVAPAKTADKLSRDIFLDPEAVVPVSEGHYLLSPEIRDLATRKPVAFTTEGLALPPGFNGDIRGFTVVHVRTGGLFDRMGFRKGDVLVAINGLPLRGFDDSRAAHKKLKNESRFALSVIRGEETLVLVYEFRSAPTSSA